MAKRRDEKRDVSAKKGDGERKESGFAEKERGEKENPRPPPRILDRRDITSRILATFLTLQLRGGCARGRGEFRFYETPHPLRP